MRLEFQEQIVLPGSQCKDHRSAICHAASRKQSQINVEKHVTRFSWAPDWHALRCGRLTQGAYLTSEQQATSLLGPTAAGVAGVQWAEPPPAGLQCLPMHTAHRCHCQCRPWTWEGEVPQPPMLEACEAPAMRSAYGTLTSWNSCCR